MSWSYNGQVDTKDPDWDTQTENIDVKCHDEDPEVRNAQQDQVKWARDVVVDAIDFEVVGSIGNRFTYTIAGHANPNHEPRSGWANDTITISISQMTEPVRV